MTSSGQYSQIERQVHDDVVVLTLNRPDRLNAWTRLMNAELTDAIVAADEDPSIGAVVVTGAGRGFCAGADIKDTFGAQLDGVDVEAQAPQPTRSWVELVQTTKPIIAAVNGVAVGVGLTMILPMDQIIASTEAKFSLRFIKMGLVPELGSSQIVPQRVGYGVARDLMLSGRMVPAAEAVELRLADQLVPHDELVDTAIAKAREYGAHPSRQLRWIKELLAENGGEQDISLSQRREMKLLNEAYQSPEHAEAVNAFIEKRDPVFERN